MWLNPTNENTFPPGLIDALTSHSNVLLGVVTPRPGDPTVRETGAQRLRLQMQADALQPLDDDEDTGGSSTRAKATPVSAVDQ